MPENEFNVEDYDSLVERGIIFSKEKKYEEALTCFQKALDLNQDNPDTWYNIGLTHAYKENLEEAIKCYQKMLELNPNHFPA